MNISDVNVSQYCCTILGMLQFEVDTIASIMRASIEEFAKSSKARHLEFVSIVIFDKNILKKFQEGFMHPEKKRGLWERFMHGVKGEIFHQSN